MTPEEYAGETWSEGMVTIEFRDMTEDVPARIKWPFAVHRTQGEGFAPWTLTHVPTGLRVSTRYERHALYRAAEKLVEETGGTEAWEFEVWEPRGMPEALHEAALAVWPDKDPFHRALVPLQGGWYRLPDGRKVQGKEKAMAALVDGG